MTRIPEKHGLSIKLEVRYSLGWNQDCAMSIVLARFGKDRPHSSDVIDNSVTETFLGGGNSRAGRVGHCRLPQKGRFYTFDSKMKE